MQANNMRTGRADHHSVVHCEKVSPYNLLPITYQQFKLIL